MSDTEYTLDDEVISEVAKLLQIALLTGTDVVDNLRTMRLEVSSTSNSLLLSSEYRNNSENNINDLLSGIENLKEDQESDDSSNGQT